MSNEAEQLLVAERRELAQMCAGLTPEQWNTPSLCEGWRVRDVVAHLNGNYHDFRDFFQLPFGPEQANTRQVAKRRDWPISRLAAETLQSIKTPRLLKLGPIAGYVLYDSWVHQQDIRWPLKLSRPQDPARMRSVLKTALGAGAGAKKVQGMRLVANDFEWTHGTGPEIVGPSEALAMLLADRPAAWERLEGAGVARARMV